MRTRSRKRTTAVGRALALAACWLAGCGGPPALDRGPAAASNEGGLRVAAASDLQFALPALLAAFRQDEGVASASPVFSSSGLLAEQIKQGAPYDVFMAANEAFVAGLAAEKLVRRETVRAYARGSLVLAVYQELGDKVRSLADLERPEVKKIALANPITAPYGKAGREALERAGLWDRLGPKIVLAESVRQALLYARKGDAEAALVGRAVADVPEIRAFDVDAQLYGPIVQAMGTVAASPRAADADRFERFVLGDRGQAILRRFGFQPPEARPASAPTANELPDRP